MLYYAARWLETKARNRSEAVRTHTLKEFPTVSCLFPFLRRVVGVPPAGSEIYRNIEDDCGYQTSDEETRRCPTNDTRRAFNRG